MFYKLAYDKYKEIVATKLAKEERSAKNKELGLVSINRS